jgi:thioesterase domain-containing protein
LQARNLLKQQNMPESIESLAVDYVNLIRTIQPFGPYNLLGWSFGGLVAYAIATNFQRDRQEVALLALLDSFPSCAKVMQPSDDQHRMEMRLPDAKDDLEIILNELQRDGYLPSTLVEHQRQAIRDNMRRSSFLVSAFAPAQYQSDLSLFVAAKSERQPPINRWRRYVKGKIRVYHVDCTHAQMMDPSAALQIGRFLTPELGKMK